MEKLMNFIKSHPILTASVAGAVLLLIFWPSRGDTASTGASDMAMAANAVAQSQQATAALQLSADQVRMKGMEYASAQAINASNNAAAVQIATLENATNREAIQAELAGLQSSNQKDLSLAQYSAASQALGSIAQIIPSTQANALAAGQQTDAAGFQLTEMFKNLINSWKGISATNSIIATTESGTSYVVVGSDGKKVDTQNLFAPSKAPTAAVTPAKSSPDTMKEDRYSRYNTDGSTDGGSWRNDHR